MATQTTRARILNEIKARNQATVSELGEMLGLSPVSVRHHLSALQAEGLLRASEVRHGVGRPHHVYTLTEAALERFPTKYVRLSGRLLDELKQSMPPTVIEAIFSRMAQTIVAEHAARLEGRPLEEKLEALVEILGAEGFLAQWTKTGETIALTEYNCPYSQVGQRHPEVCAIDQIVISQVLRADVQKTNCMLDGAERCVYVIHPNKPAAIPAESITYPEDNA